MKTRITPMKVKGLTAPIMRPLPTIFTYARLTAESNGASAQALDDEFNASLTALVEIIETAGRDADIPQDAIRGVLDSGIDIANLRGEELAAGLDGFCAELTALHQAHGKELQKAVSAHSERFRELYRQSALTKKLLVCYWEGLDKQSDSLERKLTDRCYYDYEAVDEDWGETQQGSADMVLFAPSKNPIPENLLARAESCSMPVLILMGGNKAEDMQNMALMKSEYLYRKAGYNVLRSPFNPPRLYSAIDAIYLRHLAGRVLQLPESAKVATAFKAASGQS